MTFSCKRGRDFVNARFASISQQQKMAFVPSFATKYQLFAGVPRSTKRRKALCAPQRRFRRSVIASLYPEPDEVDPPLNPPKPSEDASSGQDEAKFLEKLNSYQKNRGDPSKVTTNASDDKPVPSNAGNTYLQPQVETVDYGKAARALWRLGWATWWIQLILTIIAAVILVFSFAFPGVNVKLSASSVGFGLSSVGILIAFFSLFWTYSYTRLSLWLRDESKRSVERARARITGKLQVGLVLSLLGLIVSLVGTQAIVGTLLSRLLSAGIATTPYNAYQASGGLPPGAGVVQPVDVLVIQACANSMMALLAALTSTVWLRGRARKWQEKREA